MVDFCPTPCKEVAISCREEEEKEHDMLDRTATLSKWRALIGRHFPSCTSHWSSVLLKLIPVLEVMAHTEVCVAIYMHMRLDV